MSIHLSIKCTYPIVLFCLLEQMPLPLSSGLEHFACRNAFLTSSFLCPTSPDSLTVNTEETERRHPLHAVIQAHLDAQQSLFYCPWTHSKGQCKPVGCSCPFLLSWVTHTAAHHISIQNQALGRMKHR